jgi:hypothetical protein
VGGATAPAISGNGRLLAFTATPPSSDRQDVFVQDTCAGATESCAAATTLVSVAADGGDANDSSGAPAISADGRYVAFESSATNLIGSTTRGRQIFLRDTCFGADASCVPSTMLVSVDSDAAPLDGDNVSPCISASGRFVAFVSVAADMSNNRNPDSTTSANATSAGTDTKNARIEQVFVRDTCLGAAQCTPRTVRISVHNIKSGIENGRGSPSGADLRPSRPALAGDGASIAIPAAAIVFTRAKPIADSVFLALTNPDR